MQLLPIAVLHRSCIDHAISSNSHLRLADLCMNLLCHYCERSKEDHDVLDTRGVKVLNSNIMLLALLLQVYNLTTWCERHPGGLLPILNVAGQDATDAFLAFHPAKVCPPIGDSCLLPHLLQTYVTTNE